MNFLALGLVLGIASVSAPGPITLGLIHITSSQGRARGSQAGLGIAGGDLAMMTAALAVIAAGGSLPPAVFTTIQLISITYLFFVGSALLLRPSACADLAGNIRKPAKAFFLATTLNPSVFGTWLAVLIAMPFSNNMNQLMLFATGASLASLVWFQILSNGVGTFSNHLSDKTMIALGRAGGIFTLGLGIWASSALELGNLV